MIWAEPLLDVLSVLIEYHLGGCVLAKIHALSKFLERLLHLSEFLGWDVVFVRARIGCTALLRSITGEKPSRNKAADYRIVLVTYWTRTESKEGLATGLVWQS